MENIGKENIENVPETPIFSYEFPDKKIVEINETKEGEVSVLIKSKSGEKIFDFASLLPPRFIFVNHKLAESKDPLARSEQPGLRTYWLPEPKLIEVDGVDKPELIFGVLHEIGHANRDANASELKHIKRISDELHSTALLGNRTRQMDLVKELIVLRSISERRAWAYALNATRELQKQFNINFKSLFSGFSDLKNFINSYLATYSKFAAEETLFADPGFEKDLKKLFDKWQYKTPEAAKRR